jgi:hypothetical protein
MVKCVILTGIPASIFPEPSSWVLEIRTIDFKQFVEELEKCDAIVNYCRHESTNKLFDKYFKYVRGAEYKIEFRDKIYVVGLRKRATAVGDVPVAEEDLQILYVNPLMAEYPLSQHPT